MRLFVAVPFDREMKTVLEGYLSQLRQTGVAGRYSRSDNLHLTLAFIGEREQHRDIISALEAVQFEPFSVSLAEAGSFRDLLWLGLAREPALEQLAADVRTSLSENGIDFDHKAFKAHITLVRQADPLPDLPAPQATMEVSRISLIKSEQVAGQLHYTEIFTHHAGT